ncbi:MAG TPA: hypothetical protein VFP72_01930 [Kineosporiaceae bacterium]|nr:hypothetical protein [Kineosporiaceae bacterium]
MSGREDDGFPPGTLQALGAFEALPAAGEDPELEAVKIAVFLEDVFGVTLSESELDPRTLTGRDAVLGLLRRHLDGH